MSIAPGPQDVLQFLADHGEQSVLVTLVAVHGSASRAVGTQMAVAEDGRACGSFSGGCIEAAVIAEALDVLASGQGRTVRFGAGSPYIDVKLPCGGGIDLLFTPRPSPTIVRTALLALTKRQPCRVSITQAELREGDGADFVLNYVPPLRAIAVGHGNDLSAFVRLAVDFGADVVAVAPAEQLGGLSTLAGATLVPAASRYALPPLQADPWTAIVFLFHDRDWEEFLLPPALELEAFYHGAIGSPRTQAVRRQALLASGVAPANLAKLRETVGLISSTRDPATLALSILAELASDYRTLVAPASSGDSGR